MARHRPKPIAGSKAGGGPNSRQVKKVPIKTGTANRAVNPSWVAQQGAHVGNRQAVAKMDAGKAIPSKALPHEQQKQVSTVLKKKAPAMGLPGLRAAAISRKGKGAKTRSRCYCFCITTLSRVRSSYLPLICLWITFIIC